MDMDGQHKALPAIGVLANLSEESLDGLAKYGEFYSCEAEQEILSRGAYNDGFIFLIQGGLEVYTEDSLDDSCWLRSNFNRGYLPVCNGRNDDVVVQ